MYVCMYVIMLFNILIKLDEVASKNVHFKFLKGCVFKSDYKNEMHIKKLCIMRSVGTKYSIVPETSNRRIIWHSLI